MSRLDELEKEELAAENGNHSDQNVKTTAAFDDIPHQKPTDNNLQNPEVISRSICCFWFRNLVQRLWAQWTVIAYDLFSMIARVGYYSRHTTGPG